MNQVWLLNKSQKISVPWNFKAANIVLLTPRRYERILFHTPCCSVTKSSPTLWESMDCSMAGLPVLHYLLEFALVHVITQWCHPTISSSAAFFLFCLQSSPASESFPMSQLFTSDGQSIGASVSATVLPMNIQGWFLLGWTDYIHCMPFGNFDYENDKSLKMNTWNG